MKWSLALGALSLSIAFSAAQAATPESTPAEKVEALTKDIEATKQKLADVEVKQRQVLSGLYEINKKIKKTVTERGSLSQQRELLEVNIKNLTEKVDELEAKAKVQRAQLAERLKAIYKLGGQPLARFILNADSSVSLDRNLKILGIVAQRDLELIKGYRHDVQDLQSKRKAIAQRLENLKAVEAGITTQEQKLVAEQSLKNKLLSGIRKSKMFAENKISDLKTKSAQYNIDDAGVFDTLFKASFLDSKGELPRPLAGVVTQKFGLMKGKDHPYTLTSKGIFISAAKGSPVKSVFEGKVSYVGELPGFGNTVIVDHGDHYYSVYSHAEEIKVTAGEEITQAQVVATTGDASADNPSGLYFEIRHFSEPYDPQQWMKGL
ncbi:murein hydrolase activator EnvC family protein [Bdellovibrio sp. HCB185ZH]|uniref:murein hydrolase activator EnvC family protein n=1 Tax=Bdellovibrio sp. HCB185ZH TaxID=3394235 RepID=UPI0039A731DC